MGRLTLHQSAGQMVRGYVPKEVVLRSMDEGVRSLSWERAEFKAGFQTSTRIQSTHKGARDHQGRRVGKADAGGHETDSKCRYFILQAVGVCLWGWHEQVWVLCAHSGCCIGKGSQPVWMFPLCWNTLFLLICFKMATWTPDLMSLVTRSTTSRFILTTGLTRFFYGLRQMGTVLLSEAKFSVTSKFQNA